MAPQFIEVAALTRVCYQRILESSDDIEAASDRFADTYPEVVEFVVGSDPLRARLAERVAELRNDPRIDVAACFDIPNELAAITPQAAAEALKNSAPQH